MSTLDALVQHGYPPDAENALRFWFGGIFGGRTMELMEPVLRAWAVTKPGANDGGKRELLAAALATIGDTVTASRLKKTRSVAKKKRKNR